MPGKGKSTKLTPEQEFSKAFSSGDISTNQISDAMGGKNEIIGKSGTKYIPGKKPAIPMKGPYKMYGQEVDPRTTSGAGPLAKYGCTRK